MPSRLIHRAVKRESELTREDLLRAITEFREANGYLPTHRKLRYYLSQRDIHVTEAKVKNIVNDLRKKGHLSTSIHVPEIGREVELFFNEMALLSFLRHFKETTGEVATERDVIDAFHAEGAPPYKFAITLSRLGSKLDKKLIRSLYAGQVRRAQPRKRTGVSGGEAELWYDETH